METPEKILDEAFLALGSLQEYHEGDHDIEAWLKHIEAALQQCHKEHLGGK